jgi:hypothetical protein
MAPVVRDADGKTYEVSVLEIVRMSRAPRPGSSPPARPLEFATRLPMPSGMVPKSESKRRPTGARSVLGRWDVELLVPESSHRRFSFDSSDWATSHDQHAANNNVGEIGTGRAQTFRDTHEAAARWLASEIVENARSLGVKAATRTMTHGWGFTSLVLLSCRPGKDSLRLDDEDVLARDLPAATRSQFLPPLPPPRRDSEMDADAQNAPVRSGIDMDSGFVEVRSDKFARATVSSVAREVIAREAEVLQLANKVAAMHGIAGRAVIMPRGGVVHAVHHGSGGGLGRHVYAGSFHVWVTLPHATGHAFDHTAFTCDHARAVSAIQWLEPLLLACMPPDPRAPGSGQEFSRASMRSRLNHLNGFGVACVSLPKPRPVLCYESLEALNAGDRPVVVRTDAVWLETSSGARINVLACYAQDRYGRTRSAVSSLDGAAFAISNEGTDIRFDSCASRNGNGMSCDREMHRNGDVAFVKTPRGVEVAVAVHDGSSPHSQYVSRRCMFDPRGIEVRLFDQLPGRCEHLLLNLVVIAAVAGARTKDAVLRRASNDEEWLMMHDCASYGSRVPVSKRFVKRAARALGVLELPNCTPPTRTTRSTPCSSGRTNSTRAMITPVRSDTRARSFSPTSTTRLGEMPSNGAWSLILAWKGRSKPFPARSPPLWGHWGRPSTCTWDRGGSQTCS